MADRAEERMERGRTARQETASEMASRNAPKADTTTIRAGGPTGMQVTLDHKGTDWPHDHDSKPRPR